MFDKIVNAGKNSMKPVTELININTKTFEKLASQQSKFITESMSDSVKQLQELTSKRDLNSVIEAQKNYAEQVQQKWVGNARETLDLMSDARESATSVLEQAFTSANDEATASAKASSSTSGSSSKKSA